ncbi:hypothetical protein IFU00_21320 [Oxalobacteraceae sp. CFBP 8761]|nr:hypothetical protein [Oxalobacteraceae sp. CFBP 8761]
MAELLPIQMGRQMKIAWRKLLGRLKISTGDDFERTVLPYLRVLWPAIIASPRLMQMDRKGIDLLVETGSTKHFEVVVQAKGFTIEEEIQEQQVRKQIIPSIRKFAKSGLTCDTYVLLHNRNEAKKAEADLIQVELDLLIANGKAKNFKVFGREVFVSAVETHLTEKIRNKLNERSLVLLKNHLDYFHFGNLLVSEVPVTHSRWAPSAFTGPSISVESSKTCNAAEFVAPNAKSRYSLLIGSFGIGKTTTALQLASAVGFSVVYIPAAAITAHLDGLNTNLLLRRIISAIEVLEDFDEQDAIVLTNVAAVVLNKLLTQQNHRFLLVIDGLDEHRSYGTAAGLNALTKELTDIQCPIILTTRKEHFEALSGNYASIFDGVSKIKDPKRHIDVFELGNWTTEQGLNLLTAALSRVSEQSQKHAINELILSVKSSDRALSRDLLSHPLFMQMTLDLIFENQEWDLANQNILIEHWCRSKINRDLMLPRVPIEGDFDRNEYVSNMLSAMAQVSNFMKDVESGEMLESIDVNCILPIVTETLRMNINSSTLVLTSLLVPSQMRRGSIMKVKFFHRSIQEYFRDYKPIEI